MRKRRARPHSSLGYATPAEYAASLTATGDRLRDPDQLRRSPVAAFAPRAYQPERLKSQLDESSGAGQHDRTSNVEWHPASYSRLIN